MLLSGGASRRMGTDKASLLIDGERAAVRAAALLASVADPVVEVGPGHTALPSVLEDPAGSGPAVAVTAGWSALRATGCPGPVLVLACDLPLVTRDLLRWLAGRPGEGSVVPVVAGRPQPLCARWSGADLDRLDVLTRSGHRAFKTLYGQLDVAFVDDHGWGVAASPADFSDTDTPEDLRRLGIAEVPPPGHPASGPTPPTRDVRDRRSQ